MKIGYSLGERQNATPQPPPKTLAIYTYASVCSLFRIVVYLCVWGGGREGKV